MNKKKFFRAITEKHSEQIKNILHTVIQRKNLKLEECEINAVRTEGEKFTRYMLNGKPLVTISDPDIKIVDGELKIEVSYW